MNEEHHQKKKTAKQKKLAKQFDRILKGAVFKLRRDQQQERAAHLKAMRQQQKLADRRPWFDGQCYWVKVEPGRVLVGDDTGQIGEFQTKAEACQFASRYWELLWRSKEQMRLRDVSKIEFKSQHWWGNGNIFKRHTKADGSIGRDMDIEEAKAALIYEAMRRRREVQQAWVEGKDSFGANGWQHFIGWVVSNLPLSWPELKDLHPLVAGGVIKSMLSPWFVPPLGYSTFPDKSTPEKCEKVAIKELSRLPRPDDPAPNFIEYLRRFEDAGFIFVAIDHKTRQSDGYALRALKKLLAKLPHSFRKADLKTVIRHHLPPNISESDKQALVEKERQGTLTRQDFDELWDKYREPTIDLNAPWIRTETGYEVPTGKSKRKSKRGDVLVEEKRFDFPKLFAELADLDNGTIQQSDFVSRVRL